MPPPRVPRYRFSEISGASLFPDPSPRSMAICHVPGESSFVARL